ncbi:hypothetical protein SPPR111872_09095 [Sphingobacterium prati]
MIGSPIHCYFMQKNKIRSDVITIKDKLVKLG